jgi:hypothetical protein
MFALQETQLIPHTAFSRTSSEKWFRLNEGKEFTHEFPVTSERTVEITLGQNWAALGESVVNMDIEFFGVKSNGTKIHFNGHERVLKLPIQNVWKDETLNLTLKLTDHHQELSPTKFEIRTYSDDRNLLVDGNSTHELELNYTFTLAEASTITLRAHALSDILYESCYHSQLFLIFDSNKQLVKVQDYAPKKVKLTKGKHTAKIQIRHDEMKMLKRLVNMIVVLETQLAKEIPLDFYPSANDALSETNKLSQFTLKKGEMKMIFIKAIRRKNIPKPVKAGEILSGSISFFKSKNQKVDFSLLVPMDKPKKVETKESKETNLEKYKKGLLKFQLEALHKLNKDEDFNEIYEQVFNQENEKCIPLLYLKLKHLKDEEMLTFSDHILDLIDKDKLAIHFGTLHKEKGKNIFKDLFQMKKWKDSNPF